MAPLQIMMIGALMVCLLALVHYEIGYEISFAVFYTMPISLVAWYAGRRAAYFISVLSAIAWHLANRLAGETFSVPAIPYWNAATRLGFFIIISTLLASLKQTLEREQALSRTDPLTGLNNRRAFMELAHHEFLRASRHKLPLTLAYIDLDHFKQVNDSEGHDVGDRLLQCVARTLMAEVRATDRLARLGGDEFGLILAEADEDYARTVIARIQTELLAAMQAQDWPVTLSIGVLVCAQLPDNLQAMIAMADELMYQAKASGRNRAVFKRLQETTS
ncbi:MAG: GGDEF domain-containing protein [Lysobacterales bacterium]